MTLTEGLYADDSVDGRWQKIDGIPTFLSSWIYLVWGEREDSYM